LTSTIVLVQLPLVTAVESVLHCRLS